MTIRMQADDFLYAYRVLEKNYETETLTIMGPSIVCLAFSLELYLKDLYSVLNIEPYRGRDGHDILKLYKKLPRYIRRSIFVHEAILQNPWFTKPPSFLLNRFKGIKGAYYGFLKNLYAISNGFDQWRYSHEKIDRKTKKKKSVSLRYNSSFALAFIEAVKAVTDANRFTDHS